VRHTHIWIALALVALPRAGHAAEAPPRHDSPAITVVSLNLAMREDVDRIVSELAASGAKVADLILLQEVMKRGAGPDVAWRLGQRLGLESVYHESFTLGPGRSVGLALLSRFPRRDHRVFGLRRFDLSFRSRNRIALRASVDTPVGPLDVYNVHLDARINVQQRLDQLGSVAREVDAFARPAVVAGDFNTNDNYWLFHTIPLPFIGRQTAGLVRFMESRGFRSAFDRGMPTHDALRMQLDWMFLRGVRASAGSIHPVKVSDHHALVATIVPGSRADAAAGR
jgi:endonuclease/exonuclease/phosphatase family metal-dependent hydrolase